MQSQQMAERKRPSWSSYSSLSLPSAHHFLSFLCLCLPVLAGTAALPLSFAQSLLAVDKMSSALKARRLQAVNVWISAREVANRKGFPFSENSSITFIAPAALAFIVYMVSIKQVGLKNNPAVS